MAFIYTLVDSGKPCEYRYIGKTTVSLAGRKYRHVNCRKHEKPSPKKRWIDSVFEGGRSVEIICLEVCGNEESGIREIEWIAKAKKDGHSLTNLTDGGEGFSPTLETRKKIASALRGRKRPPSVAEAIIKLRGRYVGNKNPNFGRKHSAESRRKISKTHIGRVLTDDHRKKISESLKGVNEGQKNRGCKLTENQVITIYQMKILDKISNNAIALQFNIHPMTIYKITSGKKWSHLNLKDRFRLGLNITNVEDTLGIATKPKELDMGAVMMLRPVRMMGRHNLQTKYMKYVDW